MRKLQYLLLFSFAFCCCRNAVSNNKTVQYSEPQKTSPAYDSSIKTIHVFVALCDNKYQGIVPVPKAIGNGQDPATNLYWGCSDGVKSYFSRSKEWKLIRTEKVDSVLMERLIFKSTSQNVYLIADAYNGKYIKKCTEDFLGGCAGKNKDTIRIDKKILGVQGNSQLLAYIGHDGLMDFRLTEDYKNADGQTRDCIVLACISKNYFFQFIKNSKTNPLVWTTGLMCPEAYTLHDAIAGYLKNEPVTLVRDRAAKAYSAHQKCSVKAAQHLLVSGF